tara:strand:+ start:6119 stop:8131 length:2013 start_codon:yes stop_codon:yes gene_type:complete
MRNVDPMAREGMRVRMIHMDDERPVDEGLEGTIEKIDDLGTLHVRWDDGRLLGVIPNEDNYELLPSNEEQIDFDVFESKNFKATLRGGKATQAGKNVTKNFKKSVKGGSKIKFESEELKDEELEETTTAGAAGAFVQPLGNKKDVVRKGFAKQVGSNVVSKGTMKNPLGKIYSLSKKTESKIIKASDILSEITTSNSQKLRDKPGAMDGSAWVGKKGWDRKDEILWPGGEIADIMAKLDIDWSDSDLTLTDKETDKINESWLFKSKEDKLALSILKRVKESLPTDLRIDDGYGRRHAVPDSEPLKGQQIRFTLPGIKRDAEISVQCGSSWGDYYCILKVNNKRLDASDWAIGKLYKHLINILISRHDKKKMTQIQSDLTDPGYAQDVFDMLDGEDMVSEGKKKKANKKKVEEEDLEEATTFSSVFGGGFPVTPFMWAKKGKHLPSKKSLYKGGKIVQKVGGDGILSEENEVKDSPFPGLTSTELRDILTHSGLQNVKYVKKDTYSTDSNEDFVRNLMKHKPKILQGYMELAKTEEPLIASLNGKTYIVWKKLGGNTLFNEINKIKWVKGGKFVKIKDKCTKYNNKPWCSQGAVDNPLELSDTVFENVKNIAKKTGLSEESILDKIKAKLKGVTPEQMEYNKKHKLPIWWQGSKEGFYEKMEPRKNNTGSN